MHFKYKMTVSYQFILYKITPMAIARLLFKWKGSTYKLVWKDLLIYILTYYLIRAVYELLSLEDKIMFLSIVEYCQRYCSYLPSLMILGFYLSRVLFRFFDQYSSLAFPSRLATNMDAYIYHEDPERGTMIRRTVIRYVMLSYTIVMSSVSTSVKKRFPTSEHLRNAGLMTEGELIEIEKKLVFRAKWNLPIVWASNLIAKTFGNYKNPDFIGYDMIIKDLSNFRRKLLKILNQDHVQMPLCYTQTVTLVIYFYFVACLFSRQVIERRKMSVELIFPFFTFFQFVVYMGLLKAAEEALNPFGEDDNDFEINSLIDELLTNSMQIVKGTMQNLPPLQKDKWFYRKTHRIQLPYTVASFRDHIPFGFQKKAK